MPAPVNTLLIDGSFEELCEELASYLDDLKKKQGDENANLKGDVGPLLEDGRKDDALKKVVTASSVLNTAPEKEITAAYNLLIHLVNQSENIDQFLPKICNNLSAPFTTTPHSAALSLSILTTIFNILPQDDDTRYHVFLAILKVVRGTSTFEALKPQLKGLERWVAEWELDEEDQQKLYIGIVEAAEEGSDRDTAYAYMLRALRTMPSTEVSSKQARDLSVRALKSALTHPSHFDFQDLTALDSIQALRKSDPVFFELLEIFSADQLDEYHDFQEEHQGFEEEQGLDLAVLERKMRLLTLASLAAATPSRSLPYLQISRALKIPAEEVEMWVIDVIRAGLIEGKLSQLNQTFLIHRSTYRVFGEKQWTEVSGRLETWRNSLEQVLIVVRQERKKIIQEKEREWKDAESKGPSQSGRDNRGNRSKMQELDINAD